MFCPGCGSNQSGQYCRACGADLRVVRLAVEKPEVMALASGTARDEIGHAVADKIRELKSVKELSKIVEEVLPELDRFLETPEEKRLRRIRRGTITSSIGLAAGVAFTIFGSLIKMEEFIFFGCLGFVFFVIGIGVMINGWYFTAPPKVEAEPVPESLQKTIGVTALRPSAGDTIYMDSVTDHTTHQLPEIPVRSRQSGR